jgi:hypothetical protein
VIASYFGQKINMFVIADTIFFTILQKKGEPVSSALPLMTEKCRWAKNSYGVDMLKNCKHHETSILSTLILLSPAILNLVGGLYTDRYTLSSASMTSVISPSSDSTYQ